MNRIFVDEDINDAIAKVERFSTARDRFTEPEPRTFTLTDDEGLAIIMHIRLLEGLDDEPTEVRDPFGGGIEG